jgi:hypothetical protein
MATPLVVILHRGTCNHGLGLVECLKDVRDRSLDATTARPESVCADCSPSYCSRITASLTCDLFMQG